MFAIIYAQNRALILPPDELYSDCPAVHLIERTSWVSAGNPKHSHKSIRNLHTETLAEFKLPTSMTAFRVQPDAKLSDALPFILLGSSIAQTDFKTTAYWLNTLNFITTIDTSANYLVVGFDILM